VGARPQFLGRACRRSQNGPAGALADHSFGGAGGDALSPGWSHQPGLKVRNELGLMGVYPFSPGWYLQPGLKGPLVADRAIWRLKGVDGRPVFY
jgi:hypothetical protein